MDLSKAEMFKTLGVESRIRIIDQLKTRGPLGVNELSEILGITPSAVSQHLKVLRHAGLVRSERQGYWVPYKVDELALEQCRQQLVEVCSCGCDGTGRLREGELKESEDKMTLLKKWEEELERELREVRSRMAELDKDDR